MPIPVSEGCSGVGETGKVCDRTMVTCGFAKEKWPFNKTVVDAVSGVSERRRDSRYVAQRCSGRTYGSRWRINLSCLENDVDFCLFLLLLKGKVILGDGFSKRSPHRTNLGAVSVFGLRSCRFAEINLTRPLLVLRRGEVD